MAVIDRVQSPSDSPTRPPLNTITVVNPVTCTPIGQVPATSADEVRAAVERARAAQVAWAKRSIKERGDLLKKWSVMMLEAQAELIEIVRRETGKPDGGAYEELMVVDMQTHYYAYRAARFLKPEIRKPLIPLAHKAMVFYQPHGVVGVISAWNFPLLLGFSDSVAALIAGNAVVLKPSEFTPYTSLFAADMMYKAGIPRDVFQVVTGAGETGAALCDYADYIAFTGSTATGRKIAVRCAERLIPYSLELGGKDPAIVLRDADLDRAAAGVVIGALENAGQACVSTERVYVDKTVYQPFMQKLLARLETFKVGSENGYHVDMGCMTTERELSRAEDHIQDALAKGAQIVYGGKRRPDLGPRFIEPTVLVNVNHDMKVMREETFGPLIPIMTFDSEDEAIRLANDTEYGLSACIYTRDFKKARKLALQIITGDVTVNRPMLAFGSAGAPMGGRKNSGIGRRNGREGLLRFVVPQTVVTDNGLAGKLGNNQWDSRTLFFASTAQKLRRFLPFI